MNCIYCNKVIENRGSMVAHEAVCKLNPDRKVRKHSTLAGAQKGSIPWNKGKSIGRQKSWDIEYPLEKVLVENSDYPRHCLKKRILDNNLIPYQCKCGLGPIWNGKPMPLILDHINGVNNDHRLLNLRFVCSNCDSQLSTYKSRNRKVARAGRN